MIMLGSRLSQQILFKMASQDIHWDNVLDYDVSISNSELMTSLVQLSITVNIASELEVSTSESNILFWLTSREAILNMMIVLKPTNNISKVTWLALNSRNVYMWYEIYKFPVPIEN